MNKHSLIKKFNTIMVSYEEFKNKYILNYEKAIVFSFDNNYIDHSISNIEFTSKKALDEYFYNFILQPIYFLKKEIKKAYYKYSLCLIITFPVINNIEYSFVENDNYYGMYQLDSYDDSKFMNSINHYGQLLKDLPDEENVRQAQLKHCYKNCENIIINTISLTNILREVNLLNEFDSKFLYSEVKNNKLKNEIRYNLLNKFTSDIKLIYRTYFMFMQFDNEYINKHHNEIKFYNLPAYNLVTNSNFKNNIVIEELSFIIINSLNKFKLDISNELTKLENSL